MFPGLVFLWARPAVAGFVARSPAQNAKLPAEAVRERSGLGSGFKMLVSGFFLAVIGICLSGCQKHPASTSDGSAPEMQTHASPDGQAPGVGGVKSGVSSVPADDRSKLFADGPHLKAAVEAAIQDFGSGLKLIDEFYPPAARPVMTAELMQRLCANSLDQFAGMLSAINDAETRRIIMEFVGRDWARRNPGALADFALSNLQGQERNSMIEQGMLGLEQRGDMQSAAEFLDKMSDSPVRRSMRASLAEAFGKKDVDEALRWVAGLHSETDRAAAFTNLIPVVGNQRGAEGLKSLLPSIKDPKLRKQCVTETIKSYSDAGETSSAIAWVGSLSETERSAAQMQLVTSNAIDDLPKWTAYALTIPSASDRMRAITEVASSVGQVDSDAVAKWAVALPEPALQKSAMPIVIDYLFDQDPSATSQWVTQLPAGPVRDDGLDQLAKAMAPTDVKAAYQMAEAISDENKQQATLSWLGKNHPR